MLKNNTRLGEIVMTLFEDGYVNRVMRNSSCNEVTEFLYIITSNKKYDNSEFFKYYSLLF